MKNVVLVLLFAGLFVSVPKVAKADLYSCAKMVYKDGWLRKYDSLGNTWGANTKKSGALSSMVNSSVEKTTSSVDPGVTTGNGMSTMQYSSSWGECSMLDYHVTKQMREDYIEQNMGEIKKQIALGEGYHVDSLAYVSGCKGIEQKNWSTSLQHSVGDLYDINSSRAFAEKLDMIIQTTDGLKSLCRMNDPA